MKKCIPGSQTEEIPVTVDKVTGVSIETQNLTRLGIYIDPVARLMALWLKQVASIFLSVSLKQRPFIKHLLGLEESLG